MLMACAARLSKTPVKMGTLVRTKNIFIAISLVKLNHSHRKYSRKKFCRRIFLKCLPPTIFIVASTLLMPSDSLL